MEDILGENFSRQRFSAWLLSAFSMVALVLAGVGIYGVLSLLVASRRRELAIRSAVGAQQSDIRKLIFGEGFRLIGAVASRRRTTEIVIVSCGSFELNHSKSDRF